MNSKIKKAIILIASLLFVGSFIAFIGLYTGEDVAICISNPMGETSKGMFWACTYVTVMLGRALMILGIIFSTIVFVEWLKGDNNS
jgi:hypothetical protein